MILKFSGSVKIGKQIFKALTNEHNYCSCFGFVEYEILLCGNFIESDCVVGIKSHTDESIDVLISGINETNVSDMEKVMFRLLGQNIVVQNDVKLIYFYYFNFKKSIDELNEGKKNLIDGLPEQKVLKSNSVKFMSFNPIKNK